MKGFTVGGAAAECCESMDSALKGSEKKREGEEGGGGWGQEGGGGVDKTDQVSVEPSPGGRSSSDEPS